MYTAPIVNTYCNYRSMSYNTVFKFYDTFIIVILT